MSGPPTWTLFISFIICSIQDFVQITENYTDLSFSFPALGNLYESGSAIFASLSGRRQRLAVDSRRDRFRCPRDIFYNIFLCVPDFEQDDEGTRYIPYDTSVYLLLLYCYRGSP